MDKCSSCKHWSKEPLPEAKSLPDYRACLMQGQAGVAFVFDESTPAMPRIHYVTNKDFGCINHEERPLDRRPSLLKVIEEHGRTLAFRRIACCTVAFDASDLELIAEALKRSIAMDEEKTVAPNSENLSKALLPLEPTEAMIHAGWIDKEDVSPAEIWRAMAATALTNPRPGE